MSTDTMGPALDAVQVFANSANVVRVFEALANGTTTNRALSERTGAARSTVGRILDKGESRGWIESEGSRYELTHLGEVMIEEFRAYLRTIEGIQHLGEAFDYLPEPAHELGYHHLRDATFVKSTADNPTEPWDRVTELFRAVDSVDTPHILAQGVAPIHTKVSWDLWSQGKLEGKVVIAARFLETLRNDPERAEPWVDWARAGLIWIYEGLPITMHVFEGLVGIWLGELREDEVHIAGVLESEDPAVVSWAESLFEAYRAEAEPLTPETLSGV
jgi:predicted transcriptional regulator